ncbi:MAG TPA: trypsin-like peptidase domain-containing protein [Anaerolineales bacterium]|nr:trypsin-like peptidase domain-containing protein [Anaerolineales bacterium]
MPGILGSTDLAGQQDALVSLYRAVSQGVVSLQLKTPIGPKQGSGFVIDTEGHIITNYHVVERASYIEVLFQDGSRAEGTVIGTDAVSDLAVVDVDMPADQLVPLVLADSDQVEVGQLVIAIGNPFGLGGSMSTGIVSNLARTLPSLSSVPEGSEDIFAVGDLIQTDAAINPGNSGGPLLNLNGEVIGVNRAIRTFYFSLESNTLSTGIGFAISSNVVQRIVPSLIADGRYEYPYLGIASLTELDLTTAQEFGLDRTIGAYVRQVIEGGPAEQAGLWRGDLIINVDGNEVTSSTDLAAYLLSKTGPGDVIHLIVFRQGVEIEFDLTLGITPVECDC